jgi:hypothetical protein
VNANALSKPCATCKSFVPGHIMNPFGWAAPLLIAQAGSSPELANALLRLNRSQMHLVALAFAISEDSRPTFISSLLNLPTGEALSRILGAALPGVKRILTKLPPTILSKDSYKQLISLIGDPMSAMALRHSAKGDLSDLTIRALYELPVALRPMLVRLVPSVRRLDHLPDGLLHLVSRGAAPTFDDLVADLASQKQPGQFAARLRGLVEGLPLPQMLPPAHVGAARRIDKPLDLRALAKGFNNCLATLTDEVSAGSCAIYLWDNANIPYLSRLIRHGRFGWVHESSLGPHNTDLPTDHLARTVAAFADVGIPEFSATRAVERLMRARPMTLGQRERERAHIEEIALQFDIDTL